MDQGRAISFARFEQIMGLSHGTFLFSVLRENEKCLFWITQSRARASIRTVMARDVYVSTPKG